jgi:hypothetical protein
LISAASSSRWRDGVVDPILYRGVAGPASCQALLDQAGDEMAADTVHRHAKLFLLHRRLRP